MPRRDDDSIELPPAAPGGSKAEALKAKVASTLFGDAAEPIRIGRYELVETLGPGRLGIVHVGWDAALARRVAIEELPAMTTADPARRASVIAAARAWSMVSHPNVAQVFEVGEHGEGVYVAMELVEGSSLPRWQARRARSRGELLEVYAQAGHGLGAAHRAGLYHRGFDPQRVRVGDDGRVRVLDLELARRRTDALADQHGLCVALYEALVGVPPFASDDGSPPARAPRLAKGPRRLPCRVARVLRRGLSLDPTRRYPDMDALVLALRRGPARTGYDPSMRRPEEYGHGRTELPSEPERVRQWLDGLSDRTRGIVLVSAGAFTMAAQWLLTMLRITPRHVPEMSELSSVWTVMSIASAAALVYGGLLVLWPPPAAPPEGERMASLLIEERRSALWQRRLIAAAAAVLYFIVIFATTVPM